MHQSLPTRARRRPRGQAGFALMETTVSLLLFAVGALAVLGTTSYSLSLDLTNRETALAMQAARNKIEEVRATEFENVVTMFDADGSNDPDGADTAPGNTFAVEGLMRADGSVAGSVSLPITGASVVDESIVDPELGMPRDLDGDGLTTNTSVNMLDTALVLPVVVTVTWSGTNGERSISYRTVIRR